MVKQGKDVKKPKTYGLHPHLIQMVLNEALRQTKKTGSIVSESAVMQQILEGQLVVKDGKLIEAPEE